MVLLFWLGKGVRGVIGPISVVVLSVIWTLGMIQVLGFTLNLFIILIPTLLICVCIGDSMHIIATYNQHRRGGARCRRGPTAGHVRDGYAVPAHQPDHGGGIPRFLRGGYPAVPGNGRLRVRGRAHGLYPQYPRRAAPLQYGEG